MPSPVPDRPGLLIRDPQGYSDATLIVPPILVECLRLFNAQSSDLDLHHYLVRLTGDIRAGEAADHLARALAEAGFLEDETYHEARRRRHEQFAAASVRQPAHAGSAYPEDPAELRRLLDGYLDGPVAPVALPGELVGIAAPHASFSGAPDCYRAAYRAVSRQHRDKLFVILGTSHSGQPGKLGLTCKPFATPLGTAITEAAWVERLAKACGDAAEMEDYCHSGEHSIEFQLVFLQHLCGPGVRILPVLVGAYAEGLISGQAPETARDARRIFDALAELAASEADRLFWVLGIDLAHMGPRYGDQFTVEAGSPRAGEVRARDHARLERVCAGDAGGFWTMVCEAGDDLKWCGASPLYTFLKAVPNVRAAIAAYQQWNIDPNSLVSCAALHFHAAC